MRKLYFIFIVLFSLQQTVEAQENVEFGAKAGLNVSDYTGRGYDSFEAGDSRTSFHFGLLAELSLTSRWSLQSELFYSEQGYTLRNDLENIAVELNYLQLPVLLEFELIKGLSLQAGPQLSYLLDTGNRPNSYMDNYNQFDLSTGLGAELKLQRFIIYGRYNAGINRIVNSSAIQTHHRVLQAGIGFIF